MTMKKVNVKGCGSQLNFIDEIIVDNFAGGGGASTGMELATGRPVAIAINHDPDAILMHKTNHPFTEHMQASVWDVDPRKVCRGRNRPATGDYSGERGGICDVGAGAKGKAGKEKGGANLSEMETAAFGAGV